MYCKTLKFLRGANCDIKSIYIANLEKEYSHLKKLAEYISVVPIEKTSKHNFSAALWKINRI